MSDYESIHGTRVKYLTSDPTLDSSVEGQVWYNSTSGTNKALVQIKAWSSGGNLSTSRHEVSGFGTPTASVAVGGYDQLFPGGAPPIGNVLTSVEEYSGFSWASGTALPVASTQYFRAGTQTAGLISFAMRAPVPSSPASAVSFEYDGSSWTTGGTANKARRLVSGNGTQTAAIAAGGFNNPDSPQTLDNSESYDGSSWTATNALNVTGFNTTGAGAGTQTANIIVTRNPSPTLGQVSEWDGTNWTSGTSLNTARGDVGLDGIQTNALVFGGITPSASNATEQWDGSTWNTSSNMSTARSALAGSGGTNASYAALAAGGSIGTGVTNVTEEYNSNINAITKATWASGGTQNTSRVYSGGSGPVTSALIIGGFNGPGLGGFTDDTETYNGTSWTSASNFPYNAVGLLGLGNAEAFVGGAGYKNNATHVLDSAEYNGSSWTAGNNMNQTGQGGSGTGTQTAGIAGNRSTGPTAQSEEYDGTNWTTTPETNVAAPSAGMAGTQTAALIYGGGPVPTNGTRTEAWNGTTWTSVSSLNTGRAAGSMGGSQTAAFFGGGSLSPPTSNTTQTEQYNGTSWSITANMATARFYQRGGSHTAANSQLATSGTPDGSTISAATEEFTDGTSVTTASTLTTS